MRSIIIYLNIVAISLIIIVCCIAFRGNPPSDPILVEIRDSLKNIEKDIATLRIEDN